MSLPKYWDPREAQVLAAIGYLMESGRVPPFKLPEIRQIYLKKFLDRTSRGKKGNKIFLEALKYAVGHSRQLELIKEGSNYLVDIVQVKPSNRGSVSEIDIIKGLESPLGRTGKKPTTVRELKAKKSLKYMKLATKSLSSIVLPNPEYPEEETIGFFTPYIDNPVSGALAGLSFQSYTTTMLREEDKNLPWLQERRQPAIRVSATPLLGRYSKLTSITLSTPQGYKNLSTSFWTVGNTPSKAITGLRRKVPPNYLPYIDVFNTAYEKILPGSTYQKNLGKSPYLTNEELTKD
jgi:hypothetical protein